MNQVEKIQEEYRIGNPMFQELFTWKDKQIKAFLEEFMEGKVSSHRHVTIDGRVTRTIEDEKPTKIEIAYYDMISLSPFGIHFKPEHGPLELIQRFDKFFVLPKQTPHVTTAKELEAAYND